MIDSGKRNDQHGIEYANMHELQPHNLARSRGYQIFLSKLWRNYSLALQPLPQVWTPV